ncbi:ME1 [Symbiodinium natans]|uniref:ME1 protein n=1 Tax=Symbiodinium natans TaxID=878477 RepID=A0A812S9T5_9DINO|nr:ME1 [Symbiodinium natans]
MRCLPCLRCLLVVLFTFASVVVKDQDVWHFLAEQPPGCAHEHLPGNQSGVKVIVAGLAKCGTRTICHALNEIGFNAQHSEDFHFLPWWDFVSEVRAQKSNYSSMSASELAHALKSDKHLAAQLMHKISSCRVDAIAFDGLEVLIHPILESSSDAKVILLSWRSYSSWKASVDTFIPKLVVMCFHNVWAGASLSSLPWLWLLRPLDRVLGRPIEHVIREGGPPITEVSGPMVWLYHQSMNHRRQYEAWKPPSTTWVPENEEEYDNFLANVRQTVPKERLFEWDPRRNKIEELCEFLDVRPCPKSGKPGRAINTWIFERDFPVASMAVQTLRLFLHWVNWRLCCAVLGAPLRFCKSRAAHKKPD